MSPSVQEVPEDAEEDDVEPSIGGEEGGGPEDLWQEPLQVVVLLPPPENRRDLQHSSRNNSLHVRFMSRAATPRRHTRPMLFNLNFNPAAEAFPAKVLRLTRLTVAAGPAAGPAAGSGGPTT